jgi:phage terminase small subunit
MPVKINELKIQLMQRIDQDDLMQVEKVERYIQHVESYRRMDRKIKKEGESVTTMNSAQVFVKAHPLLTERNKVNAALLSIEKSFGFEADKEKEGEMEDDLI